MELGYAASMIYILLTTGESEESLKELVGSLTKCPSHMINLTFKSLQVREDSEKICTGYKVQT